MNRKTIVSIQEFAFSGYLDILTFEELLVQIYPTSPSLQGISEYLHVFGCEVVHFALKNTRVK